MIKWKVKDLKFIRRDKVVTYYIQNGDNVNLEKATKVMKSLDYVDKITQDTLFKIVGSFNYNDFSYEVLECEYGLFITRFDNVTPVALYESNLERLNLKTVIASGNKTILIDKDGNKYMTTRANVDDNDIEKAIMLLLLKKEGYTYQDIADVVNEVKYK